MPMCPICGKDAKPRSENKAAPFCSARCKAVDLGKWLDEEYRIPGPPSTSEDEAASTGSASTGDGSPSRGDMRN